MDEVKYFDDASSPIHSTEYKNILHKMENKSKQCFIGPLIQLYDSHDVMMHTRNCKNVHDYLNKDLFDMQKLENLLKDEVGIENYENTKDLM